MHIKCRLKTILGLYPAGYRPFLVSVGLRQLSLASGPVGLAAKSEERRAPNSGFEALTVNALRELRAEKDDEIATLSERNANLESRVAQLESIVAKLAVDGSGGR